MHIAIAQLSAGEINLLKYMSDLGSDKAWGRQNEGDVAGMVSIPRLLDKQLIRVVGLFKEGYPAYQPTPLGYIVANLVKSGLRMFSNDKTLSPENDEDQKNDKSVE